MGTIHRLQLALPGPIALAIFATAFLLLSSSAVAAPQEAKRSLDTEDRYIVVLKDSVDRPGAVAQAQARQHHGEVGYVYRSALKGYSARIPKGRVEALRHDPRVEFVTRDHVVEAFAQTTPLGIERAFATANPYIDIDGTDDVRVDVDVAVIDTGTDHEHPDLNVVERTNCVPLGEGFESEEEFFAEECVDDSGTDLNGHGTHVGGTIGAIDNGSGVVGIAPGARLWQVRVLAIDGLGTESWILAGIDWVTAHADEIEVANVSLGCQCELPAVDAAITASTEEGVVYVIAAGNSSTDASEFSPANHPDAITVSALSDTDGAPGGVGPGSCQDDFPNVKRFEVDDTLASFSNWGSTIEVAAPGVCVLSSVPGGKYGKSSGTSMASPHVAGAAAVLASYSPTETLADVEAIREVIAESENFDWTDDSGDGVEEPLLDVSEMQPPPPPLDWQREELASDSSAFPGIDCPEPQQCVAVGYARDEQGVSRPLARSLSAIVGSGWELEVPLPSGAESSELEDVSCTSAEACIAVGSYEEGGSRHGLTMSLEGSSWSVMSTPEPAGVEASALSGVDCTSGANCIAVGGFEDSGAPGSFAMRWNGSEWSVMASSVEPFYAQLTDVSCTSTAACVAVGHRPWPGFDEETLSVRWNGTSWSELTTPNPGPGSNRLTGVSCVSASECMAVGHFENTNGRDRTLSMSWDGSAWTVEDGLHPSKTSESRFEDVSCWLNEAWSPQAECFAVGALEQGAVDPAFLVRWEIDEQTVEGSWAAVETESVAGATSTVLLGVSCIAEDDCGTSGSVSIAGASPRRLALINDGSSWHELETPLTAGGGLFAVSCVGSRLCLTTGEASEPIEHPDWGMSWFGEDGLWEGTDIPQIELSSSGASCATEEFCVVVGGHMSVADPLAVRWDGEGWQDETLPDGGQEVSLHDVHCSSASWCVSVGQYGGPKPTAIRWNGTSWSMASIPLPSGASGGVLHDVFCVSSSNCVAVGYYTAGSSIHGLVERWNGTSWSATAIAAPSGQSYELNGVSCAGDCIAVGVGTGSAAIAFRSNGGSWTAETLPTPEGASSVHPLDVSCYGEGDCVAVGTFSTESSGWAPLALALEEGNWSVESTPPTDGAGYAPLRSVSCTPAGDCTAVGAVEYNLAEPIVLHRG